MFSDRWHFCVRCDFLTFTSILKVNKIVVLSCEVVSGYVKVTTNGQSRQGHPDPKQEDPQDSVIDLTTAGVLIVSISLFSSGYAVMRCLGIGNSAVINYDLPEGVIELVNGITVCGRLGECNGSGSWYMYMISWLGVVIYTWPETYDKTVYK